MNARRFASMSGTVAVTVIAAVASYDHMRELALEAGQTPLLATLLPLSVDGMILVATLALGDGRRSRWSAWLAFLVGVAASLAANVLVAEPDPVARVVSAWPAVALLLTVEVLARSGKAPPVAPVEVAAPVAETVVTPQETRQEAPEVAAPAVTPEVAHQGPRDAPSGPVERSRRVRRPVAVTRALAVDMLAEPGTTREQVAAALGITPRRLRTVLNAAA
ncbi:DUF2637 domain-containing protein [Micromonospora sp. WMMC415]|uniref:DUF2637 domain-containing protein n=1 Tax=Micromonospora sp. WMMC415 TaxID=2675222 RepID=UPI0012B4E67F|nr:DUF2637 domain-containing protein [Micromonospora sp. WMMC415]QGN50225.1 DUF2637 domain-containing protein [Micromonospora sp. WMMC415]